MATAKVTSTGHRGVLIARFARIALSDLTITVRGWAIALARAAWTRSSGDAHRCCEDFVGRTDS